MTCIDHRRVLLNGIDALSEAEDRVPLAAEPCYLTPSENACSVRDNRALAIPPLSHGYVAAFSATATCPRPPPFPEN